MALSTKQVMILFGNSDRGAFDKHPKRPRAGDVSCEEYVCQTDTALRVLVQTKRWDQNLDPNEHWLEPARAVHREVYNVEVSLCYGKSTIYKERCWACDEGRVTLLLPLPSDSTDLAKKWFWTPFQMHLMSIISRDLEGIAMACLTQTTFVDDTKGWGCCALPYPLPEVPKEEESANLSHYTVSVVAYGKDRTELKILSLNLLPPDVEDPKPPCGWNVLVKVEDIPPGTEMLEFTVSK